MRHHGQVAWQIPDDLVRRMAGRAADGGLDGDGWLRVLPRIVEDHLIGWGLVPAGPAVNGHNALVLPVGRGTSAGAAAVLKVSWPHPEADDEHLALKHWNGRGCVRLFAADPASHVLLLERAGPADLMSVDEDTAVTVLGELLARLHTSPPPAVRSFAEATGRRFAPLREYPEAIPRRWVQRALEVVDHRRDTHVQLHGDLHYLNVLAAEREPWLAIDPKPTAGPPGFDLYPLLRNRVDDLGTGSAFRRNVRYRLELAADAAGIDLDAARDWCVAHAVLSAFEFGQEGWPTLTTLNLAIAKAVDDL